MFFSPVYTGRQEGIVISITPETNGIIPEYFV
jgi:hypothetical protein